MRLTNIVAGTTLLGFLACSNETTTSYRYEGNISGYDVKIFEDHKGNESERTVFLRVNEGPTDKLLSIKGYDVGANFTWDRIVISPSSTSNAYEVIFTNNGQVWNKVDLLGRTKIEPQSSHELFYAKTKLEEAVMQVGKRENLYDPSKK